MNVYDVYVVDGERLFRLGVYLGRSDYDACRAAGAIYPQLTFFLAMPVGETP